MQSLLPTAPDQSVTKALHIALCPHLHALVTRVSCRVCCCSFLPARPEKNLIEGRRMTDAFIEARRAALERYLNRLAAHPAACRSEVRQPHCCCSYLSSAPSMLP